MDRSTTKTARDNPIALDAEISPMTASFSRNTAPQRVCPTCGELLVSSRCPECSPIEPARAYNERVTQPIGSGPGAIHMAIANPVDARRATGEWVTAPDDRDPQTRRAHPTLVRTALADAEERARDRLARAALITPVDHPSRPRHGHTAPRLRPVTPLPPSPPEPPAAAVEDDSPPTIQVVKSLTAVHPPEPEPELALVLAPRPAQLEPRSFEQFFPTPPPSHAPYVVEPELVQDRRAHFFWAALLGSAAVLLLLAAI